MANYLFPGKPRQITKPIYFFNLTSTWVGKGRTLPATLICFLWFFCHLEHLWNNLWQGIIHWKYIFLVVFIFVWERYCFWMSITQQRGKDHKTNPRHQKASSHYRWMSLNIATDGNARLHGFNFTHGGICRLNDKHVFPRISILRLPIQFSHKFFLKFAISPSQSDHSNQIILNC